MNRFETWTSLAMLSLLAPISHAQLALDPLFGNHMVLQRDQPVTIWGKADPGADVAVSLPPHTERSRADDDGTWKLTLPARPAGGPVTIDVSSGDESIAIQNVLFGDVWVCSGQSNMYWRMELVDSGPEYIERASEFNRVRLLQINRTWDRTPREQADTIGWRIPSPTTAARFSAVGFHFGRILNEQTDVPIGLIQTAWGGTPAEAWTPIETLEARPDVYKARLASLAEYDLTDEQIERLTAEALTKHQDFAARAWREGIGQSAGWHERNHDDSEWPEVTMPGWADTQVAKAEGVTYNVNGIIWLRKTLDLPASVEANAAELRLARIDEYDETYVNGTLVGSTRLVDGGRSRSQRRYDVPAGVLREGPNVIAIRLMDTRSSGGVIPGESYPFELVHAAGSSPLMGVWKAKIGFNGRENGGFPPPPSHALPTGRPFRRPAVLYNAMVYPLTDLGVAGVIWYQGESNSGRGDEYRELFPDMINSWRERWSEARDDERYELPFYFVQLPNYRQRRDEPRESSWAEIREAQRLTLDKTENTGMAITIDIGDPGDIHPTNKLPVAQRLARIALEERYETPMPPKTGPMPIDAERHGNRAVIEFDYANGMTTSDGSRRVEGVALAGDDGVFKWAEAYISGDQVIAVVDSIPRPRRVRYAWADNPKVNLVNSAGLPATPFELDLE